LRRVVVYTKEGCHLCDNVIAELEKLSGESAFEISTFDITCDNDLFERYKNVIPVLEIDGMIRLAGAALSNPKTLENALRKALFSA
jgi:hypothetical protein